MNGKERMADYLADVLVRLRNSRLPKNLPDSYLDHFADVLNNAFGIAELLPGREIYAFSRSAVVAASELRIDDPDRFEATLDAVLMTPRRVFIEVVTSDLSAFEYGLRGLEGLIQHPVPQTSDQAHFMRQSRTGYFVDVHGNGKADLVPVSCYADTIVRKSAKTRDLMRFIKKQPKVLQGLTIDALRTHSVTYETDIDISRGNRISPAEFKGDLTRFADRTWYKRFEKLINTAKGPRERNQLIKRAWRFRRIEEMVETKPNQHLPHPYEPYFRALSCLTDDAKPYPVPDVMTAVALLAALEARGRDIVTLPGQDMRRRMRGPVRLSEGGIDHFARIKDLQVITLNLESPELQEQYERDPLDQLEDLADEDSASEGCHRRRHFVRGHMFRARNNKMVWRKGHWRGQAHGEFIHRVTAPSRNASA
jgi:hypothetical protein